MLACAWWGIQSINFVDQGLSQCAQRPKTLFSRHLGKKQVSGDETVKKESGSLKNASELIFDDLWGGCSTFHMMGKQFGRAKNFSKIFGPWALAKFGLFFVFCWSPECVDARTGMGE